MCICVCLYVLEIDIFMFEVFEGIDYFRFVVFGVIECSLGNNLGMKICLNFIYFWSES